MKKTCINCKYKDIDYSNEYPCCECNNKSRWEQWQDTNYQPTMEDLIILELEKIKEEIEEHNRKYLSDDNAGLERAIYDFIEPHISELKGEQK